MKIRFLFFEFLSFLIIITSCAGSHSITSIQTGNIRLSGVVPIKDVECVGATTMTIKYRQYLGIIKRYDYINDTPYNSRKITEVRMRQDSWSPVSPNLKKNATKYKVSKGIRMALPKMVQEYPDAIWYIPTHITNTKSKMFLGSKHTQTAVFKAYKIKNESENNENL